MDNINDLAQHIYTKLKQQKNPCLKKCQQDLLLYKGQDWKDFIHKCGQKYCRKILWRNNLIEVILIKWPAGVISGIHDHPKNGCILRVLQGKIKEDSYVNRASPKLTTTKTLKANQIAYQQGNEGLHNITNPTKNDTYTLHIYSPPNYRPKFFSN